MLSSHCLQGQEVVAESALDMASKEGHWVILQVREINSKHPIGTVYVVKYV